MITAFQRNAFQNNAFQISGIGGAIGRFRHDREELERRLKAQKNNTFGRRWFKEFLAAEEAARKRIAEAETPTQRAALEAAVEQSEARASEALDAGIFPPRELVIALNRAAHVFSAAKSSQYAELAASIARRSIRPTAKPEPAVNEYLAISGLTQCDLDRLQQQAASAINNLDLAAIEKDIMAAIGRMRH